MGGGLALGMGSPNSESGRKMADLPETAAYRAALLLSSNAPIQSISKEQHVWKLTSKPQLKETLFECGSCPVLNQHGQAQDIMPFSGWGQILNTFNCRVFFS